VEENRVTTLKKSLAERNLEIAKLANFPKLTSAQRARWDEVTEEVKDLQVTLADMEERQTRAAAADRVLPKGGPSDSGYWTEARSAAMRAIESRDLPCSDEIRQGAVTVIEGDQSGKIAEIAALTA